MTTQFKGALHVWPNGQQRGQVPWVEAGDHAVNHLVTRAMHLRLCHTVTGDLTTISRLCTSLSVHKSQCFHNSFWVSQQLLFLWSLWLEAPTSVTTSRWPITPAATTIKTLSAATGWRRTGSGPVTQHISLTSQQHARTRLTALCSGLPWWAGTRKVKPSGFYWSKRQWVAVAPAVHVQDCTSLQTDNHASTPPLSFLQASCPSCHPTRRQST